MLPVFSDHRRHGPLTGFDKGEILPLANEIIAEVIESFAFSMFIILFLLVVI